MKIQLDLIKVVLGFEGSDIYWPKYLDKVMDDEDNLIPATSFTLDGLFTAYVFEHPNVVETGGAPSMGMEITVEVANAGDIDSVIEDIAAYLDNWNMDMKEQEAEVMKWHKELTESRDPLGMSDMDIMI